MSIETVALPSPVFGCAAAGCAEHVSWPAAISFTTPARWPPRRRVLLRYVRIDEYDVESNHPKGYWVTLIAFVMKMRRKK